MPQLNKGGKYVFGLSIISPENKIKIPDDTLKHIFKIMKIKLSFLQAAKLQEDFVLLQKNFFLTQN